ncbi:MAG: sulfatase-like hydrolase/transferase, partial [Clostridia bacterium]|nr:sulfatase-like hydrolase/transferase [Clostridia bacterium]
MNILYIHTHDTGRYIEPYGYNVPTPNLQKLAEEGTLFRQAFSVAPTCSPSRSALLTSLPPHTNGMYGLAHRGFKMHDMNRHIVPYLNTHGFETVLCGVQHVVHPNPKDIGYQKVITSKPGVTDGSGFSIDEANALKTAEYLKEKKEKPFFLSFGMYNTHRDWPKADDINDNYVMPPHPIYDNAASRKDYAGYIASAKIVDKSVKIVLDALLETGLDKETFIFFTTDHGLAYPNMKCNLFDTGIGVSLIIKYPGNKRKGEAIDSLVSHLDIFPTICDVLDLETPEYLTGFSLRPLMEDEVNEIRDEIFAEVTYHAVYEPMRCIRTKRYKLIRYFDDFSHPHPANIDGSVVKDFMADAGLLEQRCEKAMLFDLYLDPVERVNLADIRKGEYEVIAKEIETVPERKPDYGPSKIHPQAGCTAVGVRFPL